MANLSLRNQDLHGGSGSDEPLGQAARLLHGGEEPALEVKAGTLTRIRSLVASGFVHILILSTLLFAPYVQPEPPLPPEERPVLVTFQPPEPIAPPVLPPLTGGNRSMSSAAEPVAPEPTPQAEQESRSAPQLVPAMPVEPPVGPLPVPNRMGEKPPVPEPPKPSKETPPPDAPPAGRPDEQLRALGVPPQRGSPDATTPRGSAGPSPAEEPAPGPLAGGGPETEDGRGSIAVPSVSGAGPDTTRPGTGGGGDRPGGTGRAPQRKGLDYGVPYETGAYANFSFEHSDFDWSDYWSVMYWAIWRAWHNRLYLSSGSFEREAYERSSQGLDGTAVLRFTIERNGNVSAVELMTPSGIFELDRASSDALHEVLLPPLPSNYPHERERVTGSFNLQVGDVRVMRYYLNQMKYRGVF